MKSDEKRSHRLNYLLKNYLINPKENDLYQRAKQMGVSDSTAKDYIRTVIIQAQKTYSKYIWQFVQKIELNPFFLKKKSLVILNKVFINN